MLLLLTLALLASSTCRAQNILGNHVGTYFYVSDENLGELKGIRIFISIINLIKGIQLKFGNSWSNVYGSWAIKHEEFLLEDGEHITKVNGSAKHCLTSLNFTTNKGRVATFGVRRGRFFDDHGGSENHLKTVNGVYAEGLCIRGMGFKWTDTDDNVNNDDDNKNKKNDDDDDDDDQDYDKDKDEDNYDDDDDGDDEDNDDEEDEQGE